jgi:hypothetical protein
LVGEVAKYFHGKACELCAAQACLPRRLDKRR